MSETPVTPVSPPKEVTTPPPPANNSNTKKFEGDGTQFKGKLIGVEELSIDREEKICLDAMFKLKAVARARGEHKQRIHLQLTMSAVKIVDDVTKALVVSHEIERISFVVIDPRDNRAFGYIYNTPDDHHQFWAIKTERAAAGAVLALKELFELAFEQFTNAEKAKLSANKSATLESPSNPAGSIQETSSSVPTTSLPPASTPVVTTPSLLDDDLWHDNSTTTTSTTTTTTTVAQTTSPTGDNLWDLNAPPEIVKPPAPKIIDPLEELFAGLSTVQPVAPTNTTSPFLGVLSNNTAPLSTNSYSNFTQQTTDTNLVNGTPILPQQPLLPRTAPPPPTQQQQQQQDLAPRSLSPVAPPTVTNPFSGFDILGDLTSGLTTTKTTKESFFPLGPPPKTIQQLQMEKQS